LAVPYEAGVLRSHIQALLRGEKSKSIQKVLIVDDNASVTNFLKKPFERNGYNVITAQEAREARKLFRENGPDICILDYHLPGIMGDELLVEFKKAAPQALYVMITSDSNPELALEFLQKGAHDYVRKPFEPQYLIDLCQKAQRERSLLHVEDLLEKRTRELKSSEDRYRTLVDTTGDGMAILQQGNIVFASNRLCEILGVPAEKIVGLHFSKFFPKDEISCISKLHDEYEAGKGDLGIIETKVIQRNGDDKDVEINGARYIHNSKEALLFSLRDITDRMRATERIAQEHKQLLSIFDSIDEVIYISDIETYEILYANASVKNSFGEDIVGKICYEEFQGLSTPCKFCTNKVIRELTGKPHSWEYYNPKIDRIFKVVDKLIKWTDGRDVRFELAIDVTEEKKLEDQLRQAQKMEAIGRLAGGVAHDFNNILTGIIGYAEMVLSSFKADDPLYADLDEIRNAGERAAGLTNQLLAFSRKQIIDPKVIQPNKILDNSQKMLSRIIGEDVDFLFLPGKGLWRIKADSSQLDQVLVNLAVNARDAMPDGGKLTIETQNIAIDDDYCKAHAEIFPGDFVMLAVTDTGQGMGSETLESIFEPFFSTKANGKGTGLGLATVYGIVKQNHGFINVYSEPEKGTTFKIYFPAVKEKTDKIILEEAAISLSGNETILLVEDEGVVRRLARKILEEYDYNVIEQSSGENAFAYCEKHHDDIDLLLTDVIMPGMNGRDLYERLKKKRPKLKALFMSGYTENVIAHHGVLEKEMEFIQKPFNIDDLAKRVRKVLDD